MPSIKKAHLAAFLLGSWRKQPDSGGTNVESLHYDEETNTKSASQTPGRRCLITLTSRGDRWLVWEGPLGRIRWCTLVGCEWWERWGWCWAWAWSSSWLSAISFILLWVWGEEEGEPPSSHDNIVAIKHKALYSPGTPKALQILWLLSWVILVKEKTCWKSSKIIKGAANAWQVVNRWKYEVCQMSFKCRWSLRCFRWILVL